MVNKIGDAGNKVHLPRTSTKTNNQKNPGTVYKRLATVTGLLGALVAFEASKNDKNVSSFFRGTPVSRLFAEDYYDEDAY